ncbi:hypothetical protein QE450_002053 [Paenibacillus sp. SORGH_AS306]|uniref:hypothetical protein n=1 Tax=unclassified Paenibacillus TaxID=185978 RepID=UPI002781FACF|nr:MULTISPECIES: hypothetical protein [unclassified Paenibacillus]MDQ1234555.1 hypothetical protein [Paenibacillus sp. SORGH_AS_0306]MDR6111601.1 hypothetical protein [Paenibacillus sp. SORGH_AS_0338]
MNLIVIALILLILFPIIINYGLLTWHMPGLQLDSRSWLSFLGSYVGIFSAWILFSLQYKRQRKDEVLKEEKQKMKENIKDKQDNRSYFTYQDMNVTGDLHNIITQPNSRFIYTEGYKWFKNIIKKEKNYRIPYLRFNQYGKNPFVINVILKLDWFIIKQSGQHVEEKITIQLGVVEKDIEIYVPTIIEGMLNGEQIEINLLELEYTTLREERMCLRYVGKTGEEVCIIINSDGTEECLYKHNNIGVEYFLPKKTKIKKKAVLVRENKFKL